MQLNGQVMETGNIIKQNINHATIISEFVTILAEDVIQQHKETQAIIDVLNVKEADISNMEPKTAIQKMKLMKVIIMIVLVMNGLVAIQLVELAQN